MKKYLALFISIVFLFAFVETSNAQVKKTKTEKKEKSGKQIGEDGKVTKPQKSRKTTGKDGEVTRPKGKLTKPKIHKGSASLVFFYFGDSPATTLAQETMELYRAMQDYDRVVLLKHKLTNGKYVVKP